MLSWSASSSLQLIDAVRDVLQRSEDVGRIQDEDGKGQESRAYTITRLPLFEIVSVLQHEHHTRTPLPPPLGLIGGLSLI